MMNYSEAAIEHYKNSKCSINIVARTLGKVGVVGMNLGDFSECDLANGTMQASVAKALLTSRTGKLARLLLPQDPAILGAGMGSIVYDTGDGFVDKYGIAAAGLPNRFLEDALRLHQSGQEVLEEVMGNIALTTSYRRGVIEVRPIGELGTIVGRQPKLDGIDLFSTEALSHIAVSAKSGEVIAEQIAALIGGYDELSEEHEAALDLLGRNNVVISGGKVRVIDTGLVSLRLKELQKPGSGDLFDKLNRRQRDILANAIDPVSGRVTIDMK